jgi:hypothetical protein
VQTPQGDYELSLPPTDHIDLDPDFVEIAAGTRLLRIYAPAVHNATPAGFREWGPLHRFDHQRSQPDGSRGVDRRRGIIYGGYTLLCCAGECFTDKGEITLAGNRLARLTVTQELRLMDLRGTAASGAGTIHAINGITQRNTTHAWARWWYDHPQLVGIDGLSYQASGSGENAIALWERARGKVVCRRGHHWPLHHPDLDDELQVASHRLRLPIAR